MSSDSNNGSLSFDEARYVAFISYSHRDDKWATWLHRALESYRPPKKLIGTDEGYGPIPQKVAPVFRDREELPSATDLGATLNQHLAASACQVVLCSPAAAQSRWVNEEILAFKRLGRAHRIFCLIVDGEPNASNTPGQEHLECFPPAVRFKLDDAGNLSDIPAEPIAADLRKNKDGKNNAKLKLLSGMLGVGFDDLARRELHRRQQRMIQVAVASVTGMMLTTGLAISAILARQEAEEQRLRAEIEAETALQTSNFLVELFEVSDPSESLGNTITAREILDRGARRIEFELIERPEIQSNLLDTMGTVYRSLGLYDESLALLQRGLETRQRVLAPGDPVIARSQSNMAQVMGLQANFEAAEALYQEALQSLRSNLDMDQGELANTLYGLADLYSLMGNFERAEEVLRETITIQEGVARQSELGESLELARSLDQLGMVLTSSARYEEAEPLLREALAMRRRILPADVHPDIDDSLNNLAIFLYQLGDYEESERLFRESLAINLQLLGPEHPDLAIFQNNLAFVLHDMGDYEAAETYYRQALAIRQSSLGEDHPQVARLLNNLAFVFYDQGDLGAAMEYSERAVTTYRAAFEGDHPDTAYALQNLASWMLETGNTDDSAALLQEALAMNERILPPEHPDIAITQSGMALLLLETGQPQAAREMAQTARVTLEASYGEEHWRSAWARSIEGGALMEMGDLTAAEPLLVEAYNLLQADAGARNYHIDRTKLRLDSLYSATGRAGATGSR